MVLDNLEDLAKFAAKTKCKKCRIEAELILNMFVGTNNVPIKIHFDTECEHE